MNFGKKIGLPATNKLEPRSYKTICLFRAISRTRNWFKRLTLQYHQETFADLEQENHDNPQLMYGLWIPSWHIQVGADASAHPHISIYVAYMFIWLPLLDACKNVAEYVTAAWHLHSSTMNKSNEPTKLLPPKWAPSSQSLCKRPSGHLPKAAWANGLPRSWCIASVVIPRVKLHQPGTRVPFWGSQMLHGAILFSKKINRSRYVYDKWTAWECGSIERNFWPPSSRHNTHTSCRMPIKPHIIPCLINQ